MNIHIKAVGNLVSKGFKMDPFNKIEHSRKKSIHFYHSEEKDSYKMVLGDPIMSFPKIFSPKYTSSQLSPFPEQTSIEFLVLLCPPLMCS